MAMDVPKESKVYTTKYADFRGVDFTNDMTNIWYRRSPTGLNMIPDDAGKPFKRHGWVEVISTEAFLQTYEEYTGSSWDSDFQINRCYYFELAGLDHIVIFTNIGVFCYRQMEDEPDALSCWTTDETCVESFDRTYFFEGNGTAAFYIYGEYEVWRYKYDSENERLVFEALSQTDVYIPLIRIAVSPDGEQAELLEDVNLLGTLVKERFQNNIALTTAITGDIKVEIDSNVYANKTSSGTVFTYTTDWTVGGSVVDIKDYGITVFGTPENGNTITVSMTLQTVLALEVDESRHDEVQVFTMNNSGEYKNEVTVVTGAPSTGECRLETNDGTTRLIYADAYTQVIEGEDVIEVTYPRDKVDHYPKEYPKTQDLVPVPVHIVGG